jgi:hypothetical protein
LLFPFPLHVFAVMRDFWALGHQSSRCFKYLKNHLYEF